MNAHDPEVARPEQTGPVSGIRGPSVGCSCDTSRQLSVHMFLKWTHRELNPDLQSAELASSPWTMSPCGQAGDCRPEVGGRNKKSSLSLRSVAFSLIEWT